MHVGQLALVDALEQLERGLARARCPCACRAARRARTRSRAPRSSSWGELTPRSAIRPSTRCDAAALQDRRQLGEVAVHDQRALAVAREPLLRAGRARRGSRSTATTRPSGALASSSASAVAAAAGGRVGVHAARARRERLERLAQHHRLVDEARHHSPSSASLRAIAWRFSRIAEHRRRAGPRSAPCPRARCACPCRPRAHRASSPACSRSDAGIEHAAELVDLAVDGAPTRRCGAASRPTRSNCGSCASRSSNATHSLDRIGDAGTGRDPVVITIRRSPVAGEDLPKTRRQGGSALTVDRVLVPSAKHTRSAPCRTRWRLGTTCHFLPLSIASYGDRRAGVNFFPGATPCDSNGLRLDVTVQALSHDPAAEARRTGTIDADRASRGS